MPSLIQKMADKVKNNENVAKTKEKNKKSPL